MFPHVNRNGCTFPLAVSVAAHLPSLCTQETPWNFEVRSGALAVSRDCWPMPFGIDAFAPDFASLSEIAGLGSYSTPFFSA